VPFMTSGSKAIWNWRGRDDDGARRKGMSRRWRAVVQCLAVTAIGTVLVLVIRRLVVGLVAFSLAGLILAAGLFIPPIFAWLEGLGRLLGDWARVGLTYLLLGFIFFVWFTPARFVLMLLRRDPMTRAFPTGLSTYWVSRSPVKSSDHYRDQL